MSCNTPRLSYKDSLLATMIKKTVQVLPHGKVVVGDNPASSPASVAASELVFAKPEITTKLFHHSEITFQLDLGFNGSVNGTQVCNFSDLYDICCGELTPNCEE
jgi:hypothetical protein